MFSVLAAQALSDCERITAAAPLDQPINAASSLAFVVAGAWLLSRRRHRHDRGALLGFAAALAVVGLGSAAYHADGGRLAHWLHDVGLVSPLLVLAAVSLARRWEWSHRRTRTVIGGSLTTIAVLLALQPTWSVGATSAVVAVHVVAEVDAWRSRRRRTGPRIAAAAAGATALFAGALIDVVSGTGAALCRPDSMLQGHALWHLLAAAGLALYAWSALGVWHDGARRDPDGQARPLADRR